MRNVNVRYDRRDPTAQQAVANADKRRAERCGRCRRFAMLGITGQGCCKYSDRQVFVGTRACDKFSGR